MTVTTSENLSKYRGFVLRSDRAGMVAWMGTLTDAQVSALTDAVAAEKAGRDEFKRVTANYAYFEQSDPC